MRGPWQSIWLASFQLRDGGESRRILRSFLRQSGRGPTLRGHVYEPGEKTKFLRIRRTYSLKNRVISHASKVDYMATFVASSI